MKKKLLSLVLVAAMGITMLVGCTGPATNPGGTQKPGTENGGTENGGTEPEFQVNQAAIDNLIANSQGQKIELDLWCSETTQYQTVMAEVVASFKAQYPTVDLVINIGAQSEGAVKDRVLEDPEEAADVFVFAGDQLDALVKADVLKEVNPITFDIKNANGAGPVNAASINGKLHAYPLTCSNGYFLYYNKNYVTAEQAQSWEGLLEAAKACNGKVGMDLGNAWYLFGFFLGGGCTLSYDGVQNSCDWNSPQGVKVANAIMNITKNANFLPVGDKDAKSMIAADPASLIAFVDGTWDAEPFQKAYGDGYAATKLPTFNMEGQATQMGSFSGNKMVGVNSYSENAGWAMLLAEWITNEANQTKIGLAVSEAPANTVAAQNEGFTSNVALSALAAQAPYAQVEWVNGNFWSPANALGAILIEGTDNIQEALDTAVLGITQP